MIEPDLKGKISTASLKPLFVAKSMCKSIDESKLMIFNKLFDDSINQQFKVASFEVLFEQISDWDEIADEVTVPLLKKKSSNN